jgi:hypothetical protein
MHDDRPHAVEVLPEVIKMARQGGLEFTTPLRWLGKARGRMERGEALEDET